MSFIEKRAREWSRPTLEVVGGALDRWNVSPDWVTLTGLVLTLGVAALAALGEIRWAGLAYIFAGACDSLDGALARVSGKGSRFGAFLDSTLDRLEESIVFIGLAIYYSRVGGRWEIPVILIATVGSLMVSYTRARAEGLGVACKDGLMTRPVRVLLMVVGMLVNQVFIALIVLAVTSLFTMLQRIYLVWRMTGGERGGWGPVRDPFIVPASPRPEPIQSDTGGPP